MDNIRRCLLREGGGKSRCVVQPKANPNFAKITLIWQLYIKGHVIASSFSIFNRVILLPDRHWWAVNVYLIWYVCPSSFTALLWLTCHTIVASCEKRKGGDKLCLDEKTDEHGIGHFLVETSSWLRTVDRAPGWNFPCWERLFTKCIFSGWALYPNKRLREQRTDYRLKRRLHNVLTYVIEDCGGCQMCRHSQFIWRLTIHWKMESNSKNMK